MQVVREDGRVEKLLYHISHDVAAPVRQIASLVSMLRDTINLEPDSEAATYIDYLSSQSELAQHMLNALLQLSRIDASCVEAEPLSLATCFEALGQRHPGLDIDCQVDDDTVLLADQTFFEALLDQLVNNVLEHSTSDRLSVWVTADDKWQNLHLQDHGIGLDDAAWERFQAPFARRSGTAEVGQLGIGLALVVQIVKAHGWRLHHLADAEGLHLVLEIPTDG